jgi:mannose-6-phosphate isomerase-like protein (cupin superfamily)
MTSLALVFVASMLQAAPPAPAPQTAAPPAQAPARPAAQAASSSTTSARTGSIELAVVSGRGTGIADAVVSVEGAASRRGTTTASGGLLLINLPAGVYRCRIERDGYITLEKEVTVRAGARTGAEAVLTPAPPAPPPPAPAPAPAPAPVVESPKLSAGAPTALSLSDLAEQMLKDRGNVVERFVGCSGASQSRLLLMRDVLNATAMPDADQMLYVVAGEGELKIDAKTQTLTAGWFGLVPRGSTHSITKRGRGPAIIVYSVVSGVPCPGK